MNRGRKWIYFVCLFIGSTLFASSLWKAPKLIYIPITFSHLDEPLIEVKIESKNYLCVLDLGCTFSQIHLNQEILEGVQKKSIGTIEMVDFRGNVYDTPLFCLPKVQIEGLPYFEVIVSEYSRDFKKNTILWAEKPKGTPIRHVGLLGSHLLQRNNFLLDIPHAQLVVCNELTVLSKRGIFSKQSIVIPLKTIGKALYLEMETDFGKKTFLLDTGSPVSVLKDLSIKDGESLQESHGIPTANAHLKVEGKTLEAILFYELPITDDFKCDGILGMSFFRQYAIYFDFEKKLVHLSDIKSE